MFLDETTSTISLQKSRSRATASRDPSPGCRSDGSKRGYEENGLLVPVSFTVPKRVSISESLHLTAFKDNILISHLLKKFSVELSSSRQQHGDGPWILYALQSREASSTPYNSVLSLAASFYGRVNQEKTILDYSARTYGVALRQLKSDLEDVEQTDKSLTAMLSSLLLSMYELVAFSHRSGWLQHFNGIGVLVSSDSPSHKQSELTNDPDQNGRAVCIPDQSSKRHFCLEQDIYCQRPQYFILSELMSAM